MGPVVTSQKLPRTFYLDNKQKHELVLQNARAGALCFLWPRPVFTKYFPRGLTLLGAGGTGGLVLVRISPKHLSRGTGLFSVALFDMPNSYRFNILSISIFSEISLSISISIFSKISLSISISIFSRTALSISISIFSRIALSISIFLEWPYRYQYFPILPIYRLSI